MALGKRNSERQAELMVATPQLPVSPGHVFHEKLNGLLAKAGFDACIEGLCEPYSAKSGRPGIPLGVDFRMLLVNSPLQNPTEEPSHMRAVALYFAVE
ncbi:MAG: hypothetical protein ACKOGA_23305 [Planctomycetaceae bacterium]